MPVYLTDTATEQLAHIHHYIVEQSHHTQIADKLIDDIVNGAFDLLSQSPQIGRKLANENERFIVIREHSIYYQIQGNDIAIVGVFGKGKNWRNA